MSTAFFTMSVLGRLQLVIENIRLNLAIVSSAMIIFQSQQAFLARYFAVSLFGANPSGVTLPLQVNVYHPVNSSRRRPYFLLNSQLEEGRGNSNQ